MLNTTPPDQLCDARGRPYFLWDVDMTIHEFRARLTDPDPEVRAYHLGRLMREARPDDVFLFASESDIRGLWPRLERYLGRERPFWTWLLGRWAELSSG